ncbi:MAG TPA: penicillin-binding protein activator LpoB [Myxococcales bacterium]|jgi:hypothetical protein|nr:penicillin-binding protein activator LpoB [Myxococcales bacterium]
MNRYLMLTLAATLLGGCATTRSVRGEYADPEVIEILSDRFSENDLQLIANRMAESLAQAPFFANREAPPRLLVGKIANRTGEQVDTDMLAERIQVALVKSGRFELFDERTRLALAQEYDYQTSGYVDPGQAKAPGAQIAADYVLIGSLSAIVQASGSDKMTYYKMSMSVSELATGIIRWADDKEIRKKYEISGISPGTSKAIKGVGLGLGISAMVAGTGLIVAGLAAYEDASWHLEEYDCTNSLGDPWRCTKTVNDPEVPVNTTLVLAGCGALVGGLITTIVVPRLVPRGDPRLASVQLYPLRGGGGMSLGFSF